MNPLQLIACAVFASVGLPALLAAGHNLRVGGPLDDLQGYGGLAGGCLLAFLGTLLPQLKGLLTPDQAGGAKPTGMIGQFFEWFAGTSKPLAFVGQITAIFAAAVRTKGPPVYSEHKLFWEDGDITPFVYGSPPTVKTPTPANSQAKPVPITPGGTP